MRGIFFLVRRSLKQHALSTTITAVSIALASGLVMAVFSISTQTEDAFAHEDVGFDAVLGARGSQLQLVLNTVFHLETSPGNIPWSMYEAVRKDPRIALAIPYALGDNYLGFRVVGTTPELFTRFEYRDGRKYKLQDGEHFHPDRREAVVGSYVAQETGLSVNDIFQPYHGLTYTEGNRPHKDRYRIVGVMEPTNTPADRVVWIPIEGIYRMDGHVLRNPDGVVKRSTDFQTIPEEFKEVSAVMLQFKGRRNSLGIQLAGEVNRQGKKATLAFPIGDIMAQLFRKLGWVTQVLTMVAYLVVLVAVGSIVASIYNTMNERRREFAILRALGARRGTVFGAIVVEAATIAATGAALGFLVYGGVLAAAAAVVRAQTGVVLSVFASHPALSATPVAMVVLGALAGLLPAFKAYRTDVAENLLPQS